MKVNVNKFNFVAVFIKCNNNQGAKLYPSRLTRRLASNAAGNVSAEEGKGPPAPASALAPLSDLLGRRHNYLRISLTERCNLRCQYCMPAEGVPLSARSALLSREEIVRLARVFASLGVDKVRLTGGEPTLRKDLPEIIEELCAVEGIRTVSMTTNGLVLVRRLPALQRAGLAALNVSLDSLRPDRYERMARRPGLPRVLAGIDLALQLGYRPLKINTVLIKGFNDDEICDFVEYTRDREVEVRFIEFMPFSGNAWDDSKLVPHRAALEAVTARYPSLRPAPPRPHDTARLYQVPGFAGHLGLISSMTQHFCASCNRLRLTADGNLKVCLFGASEVSLRDAVRAGASDDDVAALVRAALRNKRARHAARGTSAPARRVAARAYSTRAGDGEGQEEEEGGVLTHLDAAGRARMVDVSGKPVTARAAEAECVVVVSARLVRLLRDARVPKGDALTVAQVAGALAAKRTASLIPLCHPLPLDVARVRVHLPRGECAGGGEVRVSCVTRVTARTGAEMEALTGCAVAALTFYDMCKSVDRAMRITDLRLVRKSGGSSDAREGQGQGQGQGEGAGERPPPLRAPDTSPLRVTETFAPTNFSHF